MMKMSSSLIHFPCFLEWHKKKNEVVSSFLVTYLLSLLYTVVVWYTMYKLCIYYCTHTHSLTS